MNLTVMFLRWRHWYLVRQIFINFFYQLCSIIGKLRPQNVSNLQSFLDLILDMKDSLLKEIKWYSSFLMVVVVVSYEDQTNMTNLFIIVIALEMIYFIQGFNLVLLHWFVVNLLQIFVSGSKTMLTLNGKVTQGVSYSTYKMWLNVY